MAAIMCSERFLISKFCVLTRLSVTTSNITRFKHDKPKSVNDRDNWVSFTSKGDAVVCWHPEQEFPYERSKPLPIMDPELREGDSALKIQHRLEDLHRYRPDGPTMEELMKITFTNKHIWYPQNRKRFRNPNPPVDREGI